MLTRKTSTLTHPLVLKDIVGTAVATIPIVVPAAASASLFQRVWPPAILMIGMTITVAWTALLGYALISFLEWWWSTF
jgi:hypothetical protein